MFELRQKKHYFIKLRIYKVVKTTNGRLCIQNEFQCKQNMLEL